MISDFCRKRVAPHLLPVYTEALRKFLIVSVDTGVGVPRYAGKYDWTAMGMLTNVPAEMLVGAGRHITPLLDAIGRSVTRPPRRAAIKTQTTVRPPPVMKYSLRLALQKQTIWQFWAFESRDVMEKTKCFEVR